MQVAIGIYQFHFVQHARQPCTFFRQEAGIFLVALVVFQIDFVVRNIPVSANNKLASERFQCHQVRQENIHETKFRLLSFFARRTGWAVD